VKQKEPCPGFAPTFTCANLKSPGQTLCASCKGRQFELDVCSALRDLGGSVTHNINIDGSQCDILAEFEEKLNCIYYYVECKSQEQPVGVNAVNQLYAAFLAATKTRRYDKGMLVTRSGLTQDAQAKANALGLIAHTLEELRERRADFRPYLKSIVAEYEEGVFFTEKYYISLDAVQDGSTKCSSLEAIFESFCSDEINGPLLIVMGDFGAGKSTTLRRFCWKRAKSYLSDSKGKRIPIFVNLRDFHLTMDLNKTLIGMLIDEYGLKLDGLNTFRQLNREGRLIMLLDAFDEMVARTGPEFLLPAIQQFEKVLSPAAKIILTVRTHFLRDSEHLAVITKSSALQTYARGKGYPLACIQPLSREKMEEYVTHIAPETSLAFFGNPRLQELSTRPILLDMVVQTLPELQNLNRAPSVADLYRAYCDQWLDRDDWRCKMDHKSRRVFSEHLAYHFYKANISSLHYSELPPIILKQFPDIHTFRDLEYFDTDVRTSSFLSRDASGHYSFTHKSFYEYFVASKVISDARSDQPVEMGNRYSAEILDFMEEMCKPELANWTPDEAGRVMRVLFELFCSSHDSIVRFRQAEGLPGYSNEFDGEAASAVSQVIEHVRRLFLKSRCQDWGLLVFEYGSRRFTGEIAIACSALDWRILRMRRIEGRVSHFISMFVVPLGVYEYKYLEDREWEPRENRTISVTEEAPVALHMDRHLTTAWEESVLRGERSKITI
jgi:Restriction endonuclease/NACHT domain